MSSKCSGSESSYNRGCRCALCKRAAVAARRERRRLEREAVGGLAEVSDIGHRVSYTPSSNQNSVEAAVRKEISALSGPRPGLVAAALAMPRILDNPKAISSQPPAAGRLMQVLDKLRASSPARGGPLRVVREMTDR